jgi:hypothetical protein
MGFSAEALLLIDGEGKVGVILDFVFSTPISIFPRRGGTGLNRMQRHRVTIFILCRRREFMDHSVVNISVRPPRPW